MTADLQPDLAHFLRARRAAVQPEDVGIPRSPRRRVPGLRREEVAQRAHVSVEWYSWLEQGRDVSPSLDVLDALGTALRLTASEREHLLRLAGHRIEAWRPSRDVDPQLAATAHSLVPLPAAVLDNSFSVLACNDPYRYLVDDLASVPPMERNCALLSFCDPSWNLEGGDREEVLRHYTRMLRTHAARFPEDGSVREVIARLHERSSDFRRLWAEHEVGEERTDAIRAVRSSRHGVLRFSYVSLWAPTISDQHLVVLHPADARTRAAIALDAEAGWASGPQTSEPRAQCTENPPSTARHCPAI